MTRPGASDERLSPEQRELADGIRDRLGRAGARFLERTESNRAHAWIRFTIDTRRMPGLAVELIVGPGAFEFIANTAELRILETGDPTVWISECLCTLEALLAAELRIRVRRKFFGGTAGAVQVLPGHWSGDLFAYLGFGRESAFRDWFEHPPTTPGEGQVPLSPRPPVKGPFRIADSVLLAAAIILGSACSVFLLFRRGLDLDDPLAIAAVVAWIDDAPALALANISFAMRDSRNGLRLRRPWAWLSPSSARSRAAGRSSWRTED